MKNRYRSVVCSLLFISITVFYETTNAGELTLNKVGFPFAVIRNDPSPLPTEIRWKSRCTKPFHSSIYFSTVNRSVDSYNRDVRNFNTYLNEVDTYRACVRNEAESDARVVAEIFGDAADKLLAEADIELNRQRMTLQSLLPR